MSDYDYEAVCRQVHNFRSWKITVLSAACAEKVVPMVYFLATPHTRDLAQVCLNFVWAAALFNNVDREQAVRLKEEVQKTAEWQCEETDSIQSIVASVLSFVVWGLDGVIDESPAEEGERVGFSHMLTTAQSFDTAIESYNSMPQPTSETERAEEDSQLGLVAILQDEMAVSPALVDSVKAEAGSIAALFARNLPVLCFDCMTDFVGQNER